MPSPWRKSPPWHMNLGICLLGGQQSAYLPGVIRHQRTSLVSALPPAKPVVVRSEGPQSGALKSFTSRSHGVQKRAGNEIRKQEAKRDETAHNSMEPRALVALGLVVELVLACAELAKVLSSPGHDVLEELECNAAQRLTCCRRG